MSTPEQIVFQRLRQKTAMEKQAFLKGLLAALKGLRGSAMQTAGKVAPYAATAGVAGGVGHHMGYGSGDAAGYGRGSAEGGAKAMGNLYRGMYDLMEQGANSKTDLNQVLKLNKQGSAMNPHRVKLARHVLNLHAIERELASYDFDGLRKSASVKASKEMRIKYSALRAQQVIEKQAFLNALMQAGRMAVPALGALGRAGMQGLGMAGRGLGTAAQGLSQMGMAGARAAAPHLQAGMQAAGQAGANVMRAAPGASAAGLGLGGVGLGLAAPAMGRAINNNVIQPTIGAGQSAINSMNKNVMQPMVGAGRSAYGMGQNVATRLGNAGNALFGPMPQ